LDPKGSGDMSEQKTRIVTEERYAAMEIRRNAVVAGQQTLQGAGITETRRLAFATLQNAVVAGVLLFYSRSVVGAVIRAFLGA
jgi:hypothetical protein